MNKENHQYPGRTAGGKYCAGCQYPIDPNGFCNCGWNHKTQERNDSDMTQILEAPTFLNDLKKPD